MVTMPSPSSPTATPRHPARYTSALLPVMASMAHGARRILDPFGGVGGIFALSTWLPSAEIHAVEIEAEWAGADARITHGNALNLPWPAGYFDAIVTSPCYGNRMADHHRACDASRRRTYTHMLGHDLHPQNAGRLHWGTLYQNFHRRAWTEARRVLAPDARFILNCKDHIRAGHVIPVTAWHVATLQSLGFHLVEERRVTCPGMRYGANHSARVDYESVLLFELKNAYEQ